MSEQDAWSVRAGAHRCPTCADLETARKQLPTENSEGWRARFDPVTDIDDSIINSAAARQTPAGMLARKKALTTTDR